jgi:hypothetical protein
MRPAVWALLAASLLGVACDDEAPFFIDTLILTDTIDPIGPYTVTTVVRDNRSVTGVQLDYQIGLAAAAITVDCERSGASDAWSCLIPGPRRATRIYYALTARDSAGKTARDPAIAPDSYSFAVTPRELPPIEVDGGTSDRGRRDGATEDRTAEDRSAEDRSAEDRSGDDRGAEDSSGEDRALEDRPAVDQGVAEDRPSTDA